MWNVESWGIDKKFLVPDIQLSTFNILPMDLVLFGIQGSGKGTQAKHLAQDFGFEVFEMGGQLRSMAASGTELGKTIASHIDHGHLVPHEIVMQVLKEVLTGAPATPILFDGVPRDMDQMRDFDEIMAQTGRDFRCIHLVVPEEVVLERIRRRAEKQGRADDADPEFIQRRLGWFKEKNLPVIDRYRERGKVKDIDGQGPIDEVYQRMKRAVEGMMT
jgi:adenylate kinase